MRLRGGARPAMLAAVGVLAGGWLLAAATPAAAHALVLGSNPEAGARVAHAPAELRVVFSEAVRPLGPGLTLREPGGEVRLGPVGHPGGRPDVLAATLPALADGTYQAGWRIVSVDDGHVEAGAFSFAVGAGSGPVASPAPPQLPTPWQVAGRWLEVAGVLLLVGIVASALLVWRRPGPVAAGEPRYRSLAVVAAVVGAAGLGWEVATGATAAGGLGPGAVGAFLAASPGTARRMAAELLLLAGAATLIGWNAGRGRRPGVGALGVVSGLVVALAFGAHDVGLSPRWLFVSLEVVHLLAVGAWIGGLVVACTVAVRRAGSGEPAAGVMAVRRFSRVALWLVGVVAVTGAWQGIAAVPGRAALTGTDYGRILAVKVAVFLVVLGLAAVARFRLLPAAAGTQAAIGGWAAGEVPLPGLPTGTPGTPGTPGTTRTPSGTPGGLRRLLLAEAGSGVVVVLVAALLANTVPASEVVAAASGARIGGGPQQQQVQAGPLRLRVDLEPGTVGLNVVSVQTADASGRPIDGPARIPLEVEDEHGRAAPVSLGAARVGPATYRVVTDAFTLAGNWRVEVGVPGGTSPSAAARFAIAAAPATSGTPAPDPPDALVIGGQVGSVLVGLTAFSAGNRLLVRVRGGLVIPPAVAPRPLRILSAAGRALAAIVQPCGDGCAEAFLSLPLSSPTPPDGADRSAGPLTVEAALPGGTARFAVPLPLPRGGLAAARLHVVDQTLARSGSFQIHEVLSGRLGPAYRTVYQLKAPNLARWHLNGPNGTADTVWIRDNRWTRDGTGPWKHEQTPGLSVTFPARNWSDQVTNVADLGPTTWHGDPAELLAFIDPSISAYHRIWVDHANHVLHERMDAPGHFMDRDYTDYGISVTITPPR